MVGYLPKEVREGLDAARKSAQRRRGRLRLEVGGESFTILRYWDSGFAVDAEDAPRVRGLADLYDGGRHLAQCLIVASSEEEGEMVYEFKRNTAATDRAPLDFARDEEAPAGLITDQS
jgi:hypothetical protein